MQVNLCTLNPFGAKCVLLSRGIREQFYQCMLAAAPQYHLGVLRYIRLANCASLL